MTPAWYLTNSLGFFVQIFPCMVLAFLPFGKSELRAPPRFVGAGVLGYAVVTAAAFPVVMRSPLLYQFPSMSAFCNIYLLAVIVLYLSVYAGLVAVPGIQKVLTVSLVVFYAATQYLLVNLVAPQVAQDLYHTAYTPGAPWLYLAATAIMFPVTAWLMARPMRVYLREIEPVNLKYSFRVILLLSMLAFVIMVASASAIPAMQLDYRLVFCTPFLLLAVVMLAFYWLIFRESIRRKRESEYRHYAELQKLWYEKLQTDMENAARQCHDTRHHYRVLYAMAEEGRSAEAMTYLEDLIDQTTRRESHRYCANETINVLLHYYIGWAGEEGIACEVRAACGALEIAPVDLSAILGNALENAIHACQRLEGRRWLRVQIGLVENNLALQIENACGSAALCRGFAPGDFLPAEAYRRFDGSAAEAGYGLKSIELAAQKYCGEATFRYDAAAQSFTTRVRLSLTAAGEG